MPDFATADIWDQHGENLLCADPIFRAYGGKKSFYGEMLTLKVFEDNSLVRQQLGESGKDRVLVVDGGGSARCALIGDQLAQLAIQNGWAGIIVNGAIRDSDAIDAMKIGIKAINVSPVKSIKRNEGQIGIPVRFAGIEFRTGGFVYSDSDGILVSEKPLH